MRNDNWMSIIVTGVLFASGVRVQAVESDLKTNRTPLSLSFEQLNHADYFVRERAAEKLRLAEQAAVPFLAAGLQSGDAELEWRCFKLLETLALEGDDPTLQQVIGVLKTSPRGNQPRWQALATDLQARKVTYRHDNAVARLHALGAEVSSPREMELAEAEMLDFEPFVEVDFVDEAVDPFEDVAIGIEIREEIEMSEEAHAPFDLEKLDEVALDPIPVPLGPADPFGEEPPAFDDAAPPPPADLTAKIAEALLPGKLGEVVRKAIGWAPALPKLEPMMEPSPEFAELELAVREGIEVEFDRFGGGIGMLEPGHIEDDRLLAARGSMQLTQDWRGSDDALSVLKDLQQVEMLYIDHARLTDAALTHIGRMSELNHIQLRGTPFSREALLKFHREHPNVSVMAMGPAMMGVNCDPRNAPCQLATVSRHSGAAAAGLQPDDIIREIDGQEIRDFSELTMHVYPHKPGDLLRVTYQRGDETHEVSLRLGARE